MDYCEDAFLAQFRKRTKDFTPLLLLADWLDEQDQPLLAEGYRVISWLKVRPGWKYTKKSQRERHNDYKRTIVGYATGYMKPNLLRVSWLEAVAQREQFKFPHARIHVLEYATVTDCVYSLAHAYPLISPNERKRIFAEAKRTAGILT